MLRRQLQQHPRRCAGNVVLARQLFSLSSNALLLAGVLGIAAGEPAKLVMRRVVADCRTVQFWHVFVTASRYRRSRHVCKHVCLQRYVPAPSTTEHYETRRLNCLRLSKNNIGYCGLVTCVRRKVAFPLLVGADSKVSDELAAKVSSCLSLSTRRTRVARFGQ